MIRTPSFALLLTLTLAGGCAPKAPLELLNARQAYEHTRNGPAASIVPAEVHKAHQALEAAEAEFKNDPRGYHTKDLAYVAQRKSQLADAMAVGSQNRLAEDAADKRYQVTQDAIMDSTRSQLGATRSDLAASEAKGAATADQLRVSEEARIAADERTKNALAALAELAAIKEEARGLVITLSGSVLFASDEATLLPAARTRIDQVADALLANRERRLTVEGHTDSQGSDAYNLDLSQRRADAVRNAITARGYDPALVIAVGIGEGRAVADNNTPEGRANNRRVEIVVQPAEVAAR